MIGVMVISSHQRKGESGSVLPLVAVSMLALILALGLCLDISHFYSIQTELQNAADAAGLAGASALNSTSGGITLAETLALAQMNKYEFNHNSINFSQSNLYFASDFDALQTFLYSNSSCAAIAGTATPANVWRAGDNTVNAAQVKFVGVCMPVPQAATIFFSGSVLSNPVVIRGRAIAGNSPPLTGVCNNVAPVGLFEDPTKPDSTEFAPGSVQTLHRNCDVNQNNCGAVLPGTYQTLDNFCGNGRVDENCKGCQGIGTSVPNEAGHKDGDPFWNTRFDGDVVTTPNITYSQYQQQYRDYLANGTAPPGATINSGGTFGRRIVLVATISATQASCSGCSWIITDFEAFFIKAHATTPSGGQNKSDVPVEFIGKLPVAGGTYGGGGTPIPSLTQTVLYK